MIEPEAKLALVEFLLSNVDASVCAQRGLEWLGTNASVGKALLATAATDPDRLWGIAALGISPATVSEHLRTLTDARLAGALRDGRSVVYALTDLGREVLAAATA